MVIQREDGAFRQKSKTRKTDLVKKASRFDPTVEDELAAKYKLNIDECEETQWSKYIRRPENKNKSPRELLENFKNNARRI